MPFYNIYEYFDYFSIISIAYLVDLYKYEYRNMNVTLHCIGIGQMISIHCIVYRLMQNLFLGSYIDSLV